MASSQPDGGLALTGDKALLFHPNDEAFLMYARRGRSLVALYDPIGPAQQRAEMIWQFRDLCDIHHARPVFYQACGEPAVLHGHRPDRDQARRRSPGRSASL
jgi:phosphatidylglycerol lysyltransferase